MKRALLSLVGVCIPLFASAQVNTAWVARWNGEGNDDDLLTAMAIDDSGNIYVAGESMMAGGDSRMVTVKYAPSGRLLWSRIYAGPGTRDVARGVVVDRKGNVYVAGESQSGGSFQMVTVKYLPSGETDWSNRYVPAVSAGAKAIALDPYGNVYVTGWSQPSGATGVRDFITVKYSSSGSMLWGLGVPLGIYCEPNAVVADSQAVYVGGYYGMQYLIVKYSLLGSELWKKYYGVASSGYGIFSGLAVDKIGNVYAATFKKRGAANDIATIKYDPAGNLLWERLWVAPGLENSSGWAIALDDSGNICVIGHYTVAGQTSHWNSVTVKYDSVGNKLWDVIDDGVGKRDELYSIATDHPGNVYVVGFTVNSSLGWEFRTVKYNSAGIQQWVQQYQGVGPTGINYAWKIVVDPQENVYVAGLSEQPSPDSYTYYDLVAIKYSQKGKFKPDRDGWQFSNSEEDMWPQTWWSQFDYTQPPYPFFLTWPPISATSADFPDWPLFVNVYGVEQCYKPAGDGSYYFVPSALLKWRSLVGMMKVRDTTGNVTRHWGGSCAGFALSALLYYHDLLSLQWTLGNYDSVYNVPISDDSRYILNKYFITYLGNLKRGTTLTGPEALNALKAMLVDSYANDHFVCLRDSTGAGHAVVACSLATIGSGWWELPIYDPNYPGTYMHLNYSEITEGWNAQEQGWGDLQLWLRPIEGDSRTPILPLACNASVVPGAASDSSTDVFNSPYVDIRIRNASGQTIGYADGALIDSMPGAQPRINFGGNGIPPGGYFLPPGDYTASIGNSLDSTTYFTVFAESSAFSFHRQGGKPADREMLHFSTSGKNLTATNPDLTTKTLFLQCIERLSGEETVCRLHVRAMPATDSIGIQLIGDRNVGLVLGTAGLTADLRLELVKDYANPLFEYAGLALEGGASYLVSPVWDSLAAMPLCIYVDRNRDGTVDDTLRLDNQSTAVPPSRGERVPDRFELHQNYPNPFNPTTEIRYQVSGVSTVKLVVYDLLGREVATLVNEVKEPGTYTVQFDGSNRASGVYFYRLEAGDFVQSRMMLLMR